MDKRCRISRLSGGFANVLSNPRQASSSQSEVERSDRERREVARIAQFCAPERSGIGFAKARWVKITMPQSNSLLNLSPRGADHSPKP